MNVCVRVGLILMLCMIWTPPKLETAGALRYYTEGIMMTAGVLMVASGGKDNGK